MDSFISRKGGKKALRDEIIARFPEEGVKRYVEVFGGAGWVLFRRDRHAPEEVYNDADGELVNLFRCAKFHADELRRQLDLTLPARETFEECRRFIGVPGLTDIQRAAAYYTLLRLSFGTDVNSFACTAASLSDRMLDRLDEARHRLQRVTIEHKDFEALIRGYDRPGTLFYCDPPYWGAEDCYEHPFTRADHERLRAVLGGIKGRFVLSYNDAPQVRELYEGCRIEAVERHNNLSNGTRYRELIIRNF